MNVEKDTSGQVEAGPFVRILFGQRRMARRTETQPSPMDTPEQPGGASFGSGVSEVLG